MLSAGWKMRKIKFTDMVRAKTGPASTIRVSESDKELFRRFVKDVTPLKNNSKRSSTVKPLASPAVLMRKRANANGLSNVSLSTLSDAFVSAGLYADDSYHLANGQSPKVIRDLKRNKWPVMATLDLHGYTMDQARELLYEFIYNSLQEGIRCVQIIHGKGYGSKNNKPVLKTSIRRWLGQISVVLAYVQCHENHGGSGAVKVLLSKQINNGT